MTIEELKQLEDTVNSAFDALESKNKIAFSELLTLKGDTTELMRHLIQRKESHEESKSKILSILTTTFYINGLTNEEKKLFEDLYKIRKNDTKPKAL